MPPIPRHYLHCSAYLYTSERSARDGERFGGSGFLAHVPVEGHEGWGSLAVITNKHVLDAGGRFIRLNTVSGGVDVKETERDEWVDHPDGFDVSAYPLDIEGRSFAYSSISTADFITREIIADYDICPGDEAFLVGRLITPWGQQRNVPAVRFGNISMMADPNELAVGWGQVEQEAFLVECRSLSGFSGSPVFVSTTRVYTAENAPKSMREPEQEKPKEGEKKGLTATFVSAEGTWGPWLLGIDWGHLPLWKPVYADQTFDHPRGDHWIEQNTGVACVLPAWHILDLLMKEEKFVKERKEDKESLDRRKRDSAVVDAEPFEPLTKERFGDVLRQVSRKIPEPQLKDSQGGEAAQVTKEWSKILP